MVADLRSLQGVKAQLFAIALIINVPAITPKDAHIYITGKGFNHCNWEPTCIEAAPSADGYYSASLKPDSKLDDLVVKVNRGSWDTEAADAHSVAFNNTVIKPGDLTPQVIDVIHWKDFAPLGVTGTVENFTFPGAPLPDDRGVHVWLPPSYGRDQSRYPVIYMQDGQNAFDPKQSAFGVDWGVDEAMTRLIAGGEAPDAIVVAVDCGDDRDREYDYSKSGASYEQFLIDHLKPEIDRRYRTKPGPESTSIMGSSMGALIAVELAWIRPDVFGAAAGLSLPVFVTQSSIYKVLEAHPTPVGQIKIYMDHGTVGQDATYAETAKPFFDWLLSQGLPSNEVTYRVFPYADHNEINWSRRVEIPLSFLLRSGV